MWVLAVLVAVSGGLVLAYQPRYRVLEFLFLLRFPILLGLLLATFPFLVSLPALSPLLKNLLVLSPVQAFATAVWAVLLAWVVMYTAGLIVSEAPRRPGIRWARGEAAEPDPSPMRFRMTQWFRALGQLIAGFVTACFTLLSVPLLGSLIVYAPPGLRLANTLAIASGLLGAAFLRLSWNRLIPILLRSRGIGDLVGRTTAEVSQVVGPLVLGSARSDAETRGDFSHWTAAVFFSLTALLYGVGYFLLSPDVVTFVDSAPALMYLLVLMVLVGWILPLVSFLADRPRVPVVLCLVIGIAGIYFVFDTDHYFPVVSGVRQPVSPAAVVESRREGKLPAETPAIVVAASGGGITASLWATTVMTRLYEMPSIGPTLAQATVALSTVSGGSVGLMYLVDSFQESGPPDPEALRRVRESAGASSLAASAWGMVYPDFWKVLFGFLPLDPFLDRGWALERSWSRGLLVPNATLSDWQEGVEAGWRPTQLFNATVAETGRRLVLSNGMRWSAKGPEPMLFHQEFPGRSVPVVTAARLSATFPYVSPVARPAEGPERIDPGFHVADGGYFDNMGVVTALDWIDAAFTELSREIRPRRVLLIQIRSPETTFKQPEERRGWLYASLGPLITLLQVRSSTQISRNEKEIELRRDQWRSRGIEFETLVFGLREDAPLSWHLTEVEKRRILDGFSREHFPAEIERLESLFAPEIRRQ